MIWGSWSVGLRSFFVILGDMIPPQWGLYAPRFWQPLFDTIKMSPAGLLHWLHPGGAPSLCWHPPTSFTAGWSWQLCVLLLSIIRTLPTLVSALIATYIFGLGTLAGTTAIAIFTFAYIGKILYEEIETVDMGPFEAMEAMGATKVRAFISAIVPPGAALLSV